MSAYCDACRMFLPTNRDADYHRTECHAFVEQVREEIRQERADRSQQSSDVREGDPP